MSAESAAILVSVVGVMLAAVRLYEARRALRRSQARNLLMLADTWREIQPDWLRLLALAERLTDYYYLGTSEDHRQLETLRSLGPGYPDFDETRATDDDFLTAEFTYVLSGQTTLRFLGTVTEMVLADQVRVSDAYACLGFDVVRQSNSVRRFVSEAPLHEPSTRAYSKVHGWATYNPGTARRVLILTDLMWSSAIAAQDLRTIFAQRAAIHKAKSGSGRSNRLRLQSYLVATRGNLRGRLAALKYTRHLQRAEPRYFLNHRGVRVLDGEAALGW